MEKDVFDQRDMTILIVDDEPRIRDFVRMNLELEHYSVLEASNGLEALEQLRTHLPDLVVLDVMMPEMDGFETLRAIREVSTVPVIMLTVRQSEQDKIHGLDLGADDYIAKPFSPKNLLARIRAVLRRSGKQPPADLTFDDLTLDVDRQEVRRAGGEVIKLTPLEFRLLHYLFVNQGQVLPSDMIIEYVWGYGDSGDRSALKQLVRRLRLKIEPDPGTPRYIETVPGVGYTLGSGGPGEN